MSREQLYTEVKKHKLCLNCLRPYHDHTSCKPTGCKHCKRKHHTLLHVETKSRNIKNDTVQTALAISTVPISSNLDSSLASESNDGSNDANISITMHKFAGRESSRFTRKLP